MPAGPAAAGRVLLSDEKIQETNHKKQKKSEEQSHKEIQIRNYNAGRMIRFFFRKSAHSEDILNFGICILFVSFLLDLVCFLLFVSCFFLLNCTLFGS